MIERAKRITSPANRSSRKSRWFALAILPAAIQTHAVNFKFGEETSLDVDTIFTYGLQYRTEDPNKYLIEAQTPLAGQNANAVIQQNTLRANLDDGDRNFKKGITSNRAETFSHRD